MQLRVRVVRHDREVRVFMVVVIVVVAVAVHVLDRWMMVQVRMHTAEKEPGRSRARVPTTAGH